MPGHLIKNPRPTLSDLPPGSQAFVTFSAVHVDLDHSVYLVNVAELMPTEERHFIRVRRDEQGSYHLDLLGRDHKYEPTDLDMEKRYHILLPVASITA